MAASPPPAPSQPTVGGNTSDTQIDSGWLGAALGAQRQPQSGRTLLRGLLLVGLLGTVLLTLWLHWLAAAPHLPGVWRNTTAGGLILESSTDASLQPAAGRRLVALLLADGQRLDTSAASLVRSPRWTVDGVQATRSLTLQLQLALAVAQPVLTLVFESGPSVAVFPRPRGLAGLGTACWLLCGLALALCLAAVLVGKAAPGRVAALFGTMALAQAANLAMIGTEALPGLALPGGLAAFSPALRLLTDLATVAAVLHAVTIYPAHLPAARKWAMPAWALALGAALLLGWLGQPEQDGVMLPSGVERWSGGWGWGQALMLVYGLAAAAVLHGSHRQQGSPLADMLLRLVLAGFGTLALLTLAVAMASPASDAQRQLHWAAPVVWTVFLATLLVLTPFLSHARQLLRELAILAGASTVACSLALLIDALFTPDLLLTWLLALTAAVAVYLTARPWILGPLAGSGTLSAERMFDSLYRVARELEQAPDQAGRQISGLLREVFDPLEIVRTDKQVSRIRVAADGATLVVPIPQLPDAAAAGTRRGTIVLRYARRGRRLFTHDDQLLAERLIEQLRRALAYDRAVEQGRTEERTRIAQDLHDDIGARLLTLMYQAQNPEIEEYIRHTLQDLKTLTRGLAAGNHRLSHAAAEWKADISQRLGATGCDLHWSFSADRDLLLSVVQWSALTRVLRELVNNIITHARATQVEIAVHFDRGRLQLTVTDDGCGRQPHAWSHGLGLGGVRKRVKLLGGQVQWSEQGGRGIRCEVRAPLSSEKG